jgi:hypothetical protein
VYFGIYHLLVPSIQDSTVSMGLLTLRGGGEVKLITAVLFASLALTVVPAARADESQIVITSSAKNPSPAHLEFFRTFATAFISGFKENAVQDPVSDQWLILLEQVRSPRGKAQVEIRAISASEASEPPIVVGILDELADPATIRTVAKSTQRVLMEKRQQRF